METDHETILDNFQTAHILYTVAQTLATPLARLALDCTPMKYWHAPATRIVHAHIGRSTLHYSEKTRLMYLLSLVLGSTGKLLIFHSYC